MSAPQLAIIPDNGPWLALTIDEVVERTGWSLRTFYRRRAELITRTTADGCTEYLESSLPKAAAALAIVPAPVQLGPLFANLPAPRPRTLLPDPKSEKQAAAREAALDPILEFIEDTGRFVSLSLSDGRPVTSLERMIEYAAAQANQSPRTVKRWLARYRAGGRPALADQVRADKGMSRFFESHRDAAILAAYLYLGDIDRKDLRASEKPHRGQSVAFVCEQLRERAPSLSIEIGDLPSKETVRVFLRDDLSPALRTLAREGQRQYRERMSPYLRRRYDDIYANQVWVGDQMIHDVEVANDLFDEELLGTPIRLRLDAFEDYRSRKLVGATWTRFGSSRSIAATLRRAIQEYGAPELIYVDNGKDYKKIAQGAQRGFPIEPLRPEDLAPIEHTGFLARIGCGVVHCLPKHPQSKGVERCFGTLHHFDAFWSTYTSGSTATRPEATGTAMMEHRRLFKKGRVDDSKHPLASTFILACLAWIKKYNATPHSGQGMDGMSPDEVFVSEFNPNQKPTPEPGALALLMAEYAQRQVRECAVTLNKLRYQPRQEDRLGWAAMHDMNEREILIAYDPADPECAAALDLDGRFIAWLEAEKLLRFAPNDPTTQQQIAASMGIRRGMEKAAKATLRAIAGAARLGGARSAQEMAEATVMPRLALAAGTGAPVITQRRPLLAAPKAIAAPMTPDEVVDMILEGR